MRLAGLDRESAVRLLAAALPGRLDPLAAARIAAATGGNPLALVDLARELSIRELAFVDEPIPVGTHLEAHYLRQAGQAPADAPVGEAPPPPIEETSPHDQNPKAE